MMKQLRILDEAQHSFEGDENEEHTTHTHTNGGDGPLVLPPPSMPMAVARLLVDRHFTVDNCSTLRHWRGSWWHWQTSHWTELEDCGVRTLLYRFTENAFYWQGTMPQRWAPNRKKITDLVDALAAVCMLPQDIGQPSWLDDQHRNGVIVSVGNGLLDIAQQKLLPHNRH
jgi:putative DNA primase/helicase